MFTGMYKKREKWR